MLAGQLGWFVHVCVVLFVTVTDPCADTPAVSVKPLAVNVAVSVSPVVIPFNVHGLVPEHVPPLHPAKDQPVAGIAVIATPLSPVVTWQLVAFAPHGFVESATTTDPLPDVFADTVNVFAANVAVSLSADWMFVIEHGFVEPLQEVPLKLEKL